jgi:hypothetical protein
VFANMFNNVLFDTAVSHLFNLPQGHLVSKLQFRVENFTIFVGFNIESF